MTPHLLPANKPQRNRCKRLFPISLSRLNLSRFQLGLLMWSTHWLKAARKSKTNHRKLKPPSNRAYRNAQGDQHGTVPRIPKADEAPAARRTSHEEDGREGGWLI